MISKIVSIAVLIILLLLVGVLIARLGIMLYLMCTGNDVSEFNPYK